METVLQSILYWPQTSFAKLDEKWSNTIIDVAVKILFERPEYKKKNGDLNTRKLSQMLGIDPKTIKTRLNL